MLVCWDRFRLLVQLSGGSLCQVLLHVTLYLCECLAPPTLQLEGKVKRVRSLCFFFFFFPLMHLCLVSTAPVFLESISVCVCVCVYPSLMALAGLNSPLWYSLQILIL